MTVALRKRLARVRLFLCDVDGVLTNGTIWMGGGVEMKAFHVMDGLGMRLLQREGVKVGWVSRRPSAATTQRAEDLKIDYLRQIDGSKVEAVDALRKETGLSWEALCFVGDDVVDLGVLRRAGLAVTVANGIPEAKAMAHYVTRRRGGEGAIREVVDMILKARKRWRSMLEEHLS